MRYSRSRSRLKWQIWSLISTAPFYVTLVVLTLNPDLLIGVGGDAAWKLQQYVLTVWALLALGSFFASSLKAAGQQKWIELTSLNAALAGLPLYFLWRVFLLGSL